MACRTCQDGQLLDQARIALASAQTELTLVYEQLTPLMNYRHRLKEVLEELDHTLTQLTPCRCTGRNYQSQERCDRQAEAGSDLCKRHQNGLRQQHSRVTRSQLTTV